MKRMIVALSVSAILILGGASSLYAQNEPPPTKVTGGGIFQEGSYDQDGMFVFGQNLHQFSITILPDQAPGKKSPQANIRVAGPMLEEFWGSPLMLRDDLDGCLVLDFFGPDSKPGQMFRFTAKHPKYHKVAVWVYIHDNLTPGLNKMDPSWSDWVMIWVEPVGGDWQPGWNEEINGTDDLFLLMGVVVKGNIMDHRPGYSY